MKLTHELAGTAIRALEAEQALSLLPPDFHKRYDEIRDSFRQLDKAAAIFTNARAHFEETLAEGDLDELASEMGGAMLHGGALHLAGHVIAETDRLYGMGGAE